MAPTSSARTNVKMFAGSQSISEIKFLKDQKSYIKPSVSRNKDPWMSAKNQINYNVNTENNVNNGINQYDYFVQNPKFNPDSQSGTKNTQKPFVL